MTTRVQTAGERLELALSTTSAERLAASVYGAVQPDAPGEPTVHVTVQHDRPALPAGRAPLGRGGWVRGRSVLLAGLAGSDHVARVDLDGDLLTLVCAPAPTAQDRALRLAAPARARLLRAAAMFHYPVLWRAGLRGRVPLHASALRLDGADVLVTGMSGVGKSTLVAAEERTGAVVASDNLVVCDGDTAHGVLEPRRSAERAPGAQRTTHGRWETPAPAAVPELHPRFVVVLRRSASRPTVAELSAEDAARALVASTYAAGELRRYWPFAATLAVGTGCGPAHPSVETVARQICERSTCLVLDVGRTPGAHLSTFLRTQGALRCA